MHSYIDFDSSNELFFYVNSSPIDDTDTLIVGWLPSYLDKSSKIVLILSRVFAWLLFIAFGTKLISHITYRHSPEPFEGVRSLYYDTDYKIVARKNSFVYSMITVNRVIN